MLRFLIRIKALQQLGMVGPFRAALLIVSCIALVAGLIYASVFINAALNQKSEVRHVHQNSAR